MIGPPFYKAPSSSTPPSLHVGLWAQAGTPENCSQPCSSQQPWDGSSLGSMEGHMQAMAYDWGPSCPISRALKGTDEIHVSAFPWLCLWGLWSKIAAPFCQMGLLTSTLVIAKCWFSFMSQGVPCVVRRRTGVLLRSGLKMSIKDSIRKQIEWGESGEQIWEWQDLGLVKSLSCSGSANLQNGHKKTSALEQLSCI